MQAAEVEVTDLRASRAWGARRGDLSAPVLRVGSGDLRVPGLGSRAVPPTGHCRGSSVPGLSRPSGRPAQLVAVPAEPSTDARQSRDDRSRSLQLLLVTSRWCWRRSVAGPLPTSMAAGSGSRPRAPGTYGGGKRPAHRPRKETAWPRSEWEGEPPTGLVPGRRADRPATFPFQAHGEVPHGRIVSSKV